MSETNGTASILERLYAVIHQEFDDRAAIVDVATKEIKGIAIQDGDKVFRLSVSALTNMSTDTYEAQTLSSNEIASWNRLK